MAIIGRTFDGQNVTPKADGGYLASLFSDGILWGCGLTVSGGGVSIASGEILCGGRIISVDGATVFAMTPTVSNGFGRIIINADLTQPAGSQAFLSADYSTTETFDDLTVENINASGQLHQAEIGRVIVASGSVSSITGTQKKAGARAFLQVGSNTVPVYVNASGEMVAGLPYSDAYVKGLVSNAYNLGNITRPVYFANGVPTLCTPFNEATAQKVSNALTINGTAYDGSTARTLYLMSVGAHLIPKNGESQSVTGTYDIGSSSYKWKDLYLSGKIDIGGSIVSSASSGTADIGSSSKKFRNIYGDLKGNADTATSATTATTASKVAQSLTINGTAYNGSTARAFSVLLLSGGTLTGSIASQNVAPKSNDTYNCGSSGNMWKEVFTKLLSSCTMAGTLTARHIGAYSAGTYDIGASDKRFRGLYCGSGDFNGTLNVRNIFPTLNGVNQGDASHYFGNMYALNFVHPSDRDLKKSIKELTPEEAEALIMGVAPKKYKYKTGEQKVHWGLIAQDVKETMDANESDFGGYIDGDVCALDYTEFISPLIKVVQQQQKTIAELTARVEALEGGED